MHDIVPCQMETFGQSLVVSANLGLENQHTIPEQNSVGFTHHLTATKIINWVIRKQVRCRPIVSNAILKKEHHAYKCIVVTHC